MKWKKSFSEDRTTKRLRWTVARWLEDENEEPLTYNGEEIYLVKLRGKRGYYLCTYFLGGDNETVEFGPFPTLRLAKMTYLMVARNAV